MQTPSQRILQEIRTKWFPEHKATLSEGTSVTELVWAKPGTGVFKIIYLLREGTLYVSGDAGEAIYRWSSPIGLGTFEQMNLDYFAGKVCASETGRDYYEFRASDITKYLLEYIADHEKDGEDMDALKEEIQDGLDGSEQEMHARLMDMNSMDWELRSSAFEAGKTIHARCAAHLIGLQMAFAQLNQTQT